MEGGVRDDIKEVSRGQIVQTKVRSWNFIPLQWGLHRGATESDLSSRLLWLLRGKCTVKRKECWQKYPLGGGCHDPGGTKMAGIKVLTLEVMGNSYIQQVEMKSIKLAEGLDMGMRKRAATRYGSWIFGLRNWVEGGVIYQKGNKGGRDRVGWEENGLGANASLLGFITRFYSDLHIWIS